MGKRGPRRKLPIQEYLDGNPTKNKKLLSLMGVESLGEPFVPEHLMDDARGCIEVIKQSMPPRIYSSLDSFLLAAFGVAWAVHKQCVMMFSAPDFTLVVETFTEDGDVRTIKPSPVLGIMKEYSVLLATLGDRLGLDPKSRMGLSIQGTNQQTKNSKFAGLTETRPAQDDRIGEGRAHN